MLGAHGRTFVDAARRGRVLAVSGMIATDGRGEIEHKGDVVAQTAVVYAKLEQALRSFGASFADVVLTCDYVVDTNRYRETADVRREAFGGRFPAATGVVVLRLLHPDALIEVSALAVLPSAPVRAARALVTHFRLRRRYRA